MKRGRIEDDDTPDRIMARYNRATLEEVFLDVVRGRVHEVRKMSTSDAIGGIRRTGSAPWCCAIGILLRSSWPRLLESDLLAGAADHHLGLSAIYISQNAGFFARRRHADRRGDPVGHPVSRPARLFDLVSGGDVGAQSRQPDDEPAEADRVPDRR
jgi:hypothetical protein